MNVSTWLRRLLGIHGKETTTETVLSRLLNLTAPAGSPSPPSSSSPEVTILKCLDLTAKARSYCSRLVETDKTSRVEWRLDFRGPDNFHVAQAASSESARSKREFDEWITIGTEHYRRAAVWFRHDNGRNEKLNRLLLVDKFLHLLRALSPVSAETVIQSGQKYLSLQYKIDAVGEFGPLDDIFGPVLSTDCSACQAQIWLDVGSSLIVKGQLLLQSRKSDGSEVGIEIHQAFTCYGEDIRVTRPRIGMKPSADKPGTYIVTDNRIWPSPFHE